MRTLSGLLICQVAATASTQVLLMAAEQGKLGAAPRRHGGWVLLKNHSWEAPSVLLMENHACLCCSELLRLRGSTQLSPDPRGADLKATAPTYEFTMGDGPGTGMGQAALT